jgi:predicted alpha/beta hydrolase family esterase
MARFKNAIILHGTFGSPNGNWFQWLKSELEAKDIRVWLPTLPNAEWPSLKEWATYVRSNCPFDLNEDTLIVGHSSGAILALILAQQNPKPIGAIVAVSVFHDNSLQWEPNNKLFDVEFDWPKIHQNTKQLLFIHSDDDPYVPLDQAKYVADNCQAELMVIPGQGHFNLEKSAGYKQFPQLLDILSQKGLV